MECRNRFAIALVIAFSLSMLSACSGGGGGGGGDGTPTSIPYDGNTGAAVITTTNAARLVSNIVGTSEPADLITPVGVMLNSAYGSQESASQSGLAHRLSAYFHDTLSQVSLSGSPLLTAIAVDETLSCESGGTIHVTGTLDNDGTGTLNATYNDCRTADETINGTVTVLIDAYDLTYGTPTDATYRFDILTLTNPSESLSMSGSLRDQLNIAANKETLTLNTVVRDDLSGEMLKAENLIIIGVFDNLLYPASYTETISGRVFDSLHGYVDVTTDTPLNFSSINQFFPDSGVLLIVGAANASIRVTALSSVRVQLELDLNGDSAYETVVAMNWTDLDGPVGADLGDDDGDGMHNSWEEVNGLDPASSADAALDSDGDGFTNLEEYQAGTDPDNSASSPPSADLAISMTDSPDPVATGGSLTYTMTVVNWGPADAVDVVVTDALPTGFSLVSAVPSSGSCSGTTTVTCNLGVLVMGVTRWVTLSVNAASEGVYSNSASVSSVTVDGSTANNTATETTTVGSSAGSLQSLIDAANNGDTIEVPPGLYVGGIDFTGKDITLASAAGPGSTIIHGDNNTAVSMGPGGTITGFTITGAAGYGSGIEVSGAGSTISGNLFEGNSSYFGAAIDGNCSSPTIERNTFRYNCDNNPTSGVVEFINCSSPTIANNIFENNPCRALEVTLPEGNTPLIINNTLVGNSVAIHLWRLVSQATHTYRNNILVGNGTGLEFDEGSAVDNPVWQNNLVFGNTTDYSGIEVQTGLNGNIAADPLFLSTDDYHLSAGSPAIDSGSATDAPSIDYDGTLRPLDGDTSGSAEFDIGAFEYSSP